MGRNHFLKLFLLFLLTAGAILLSLSVGTLNISPHDLFLFFCGKLSGTSGRIIYEIRLPRTMLAIAVGGGLSVSGAVLQAILMNPLAEPYILGISSGGAFGAVLSFLLSLSFLGTEAMAFAGAILVLLLVFMLGKRRGELDPNSLLLTGVMVGAFFSALILLMVTLLNDSLRQAVFWLMGNLSLADLSTVKYIFPLSLGISLCLCLNAKDYNALSLGGQEAACLGVNVSRLKSLSYILSGILVGASVSVSGIIGFVGLLVPHLARRLLGNDNRIVLPASFFLGAAFLTSADCFARTIIRPEELPVGAVTALLGAPLFIYMMRRSLSGS